MARPYATEMERLAETFAWATTTELGALRRAVRAAGLSPLAVSALADRWTAADALAAFHRPV